MVRLMASWRLKLSTGQVMFFQHHALNSWISSNEKNVPEQVSISLWVKIPKTHYQASILVNRMMLLTVWNSITVPKTQVERTSGKKYVWSRVKTKTSPRPTLSTLKVAWLILPSVADNAYSKMAQHTSTIAYLNQIQRIWNTFWNKYKWFSLPLDIHSSRKWNIQVNSQKYIVLLLLQWILPTLKQISTYPLETFKPKQKSLMVNSMYSKVPKYVEMSVNLHTTTWRTFDHSCLKITSLIQIPIRSIKTIYFPVHQQQAQSSWEEHVMVVKNGKIRPTIWLMKHGNKTKLSV